jgi:hypothetical protein
MNIRCSCGGPCQPIRFGRHRLSIWQKSRAYLINDAELIRRVPVGEAKKYSKGVQFEKMRPTLGNGLVTAEGQEHPQHRRLMANANPGRRARGSVFWRWCLSAGLVGLGQSHAAIGHDLADVVGVVGDDAVDSDVHERFDGVGVIAGPRDHFEAALVRL